MNAKVVYKSPKGGNNTVLKGFPLNDFKIRCYRCGNVMDMNNNHGTITVDGQTFAYLCTKCSVEFLREAGVPEDKLAGLKKG